MVIQEEYHHHDQQFYKTIRSNCEPRGINGPLFLRSGCGGGNRNGKIWETSSQDRENSIKQSSAAWITGENASALLTPKSPPERAKEFKPARLNLRLPPSRSTFSPRPLPVLVAGLKKEPITARTMGYLSARRDPSNFLRASKTTAEKFAIGEIRPFRYKSKKTNTDENRKNSCHAACRSSNIDFVRKNADHLQHILKQTKEKQAEIDRIQTEKETHERMKASFSEIHSRRLKAHRRVKTNNDIIAPRSAKPAVELLDEPERSRLLDALKAQWAKRNREFQLLALSLFNLDTMSKVERKEKLEHELLALEKDLELLSCDKPILLSA